MAQMEMGVLVIQAIIVGVPLTFILLAIRMFRAARAFDRHFQATYPVIADELRSHWPAYMSKFSPCPLCPLFYFSLFESDRVKDEKLRALRKKAIHSFIAIGLLTALLVLLLFCIDTTAVPGTGQ